MSKGEDLKKAVEGWFDSGGYPIETKIQVLLVGSLLLVALCTSACVQERIVVTVYVTYPPGSIPEKLLSTEPPTQPTHTQPVPTHIQPTHGKIPTATLIPEPSIMPCWQTDSLVGESVTCQINRAHCSYRPDVNGSPTFCNDAPYPSHSFTLLVWGQDWSKFDGKCLVVNGFVSRYSGKPQIVAESTSQVSSCR